MKIFIGARVEKVSGYPFPGIVLARFVTYAGAVRYVVEMVTPNEGPIGLLHIFNENQLKLVDPPT